MSIFPVLLLAALPCAQAAPAKERRLKALAEAVAPKDPGQSLEALGPESERLVEALDQARLELLQLGQRLDIAIADRDWEAADRLTAERAAARQRVVERHEALYEFLPRLRELFKGAELQAWSTVVSGRAKPAAFARAETAKEEYNKANRFYKRVRGELAQEEARFVERMAALRRARGPAGTLVAGGWPLAAAGALAAALLAALVLLWRSQRRLEHLTQRAVAAEPPSLISGYRVVRELGRGAMGVVFEGVDETLGRRVAIKRMREELRASESDLRLFLEEARTVAAFSHPHIVSIYHALQEGGEVYLVFEFVDGRPLSLLLDREGHPAFPAARTLARQIGSALDYAHERRVIHRDLKTANVMIARDGTAKVMDFGIAHQARRTVARATRAESWGTPPYMAPEQELGQVSRESDLFSLGVCVYELATGRLPFDGPNFLAQKRERHFAAPCSLDRGLPAGLDAVLARALAPEPSERFHSAAELCAALDALG